MGSIPSQALPCLMNQEAFQFSYLNRLCILPVLLAVKSLSIIFHKGQGSSTVILTSHAPVPFALIDKNIKCLIFVTVYFCVYFSKKKKIITCKNRQVCN